MSKQSDLVGLSGDAANLEALAAGSASDIVAVGNAYSAGAFSNRNLIINGNFTVSQRGDYSSATNLTSTATYLVDRWKFYDTGVAGTATHSTRMMRLDATSTGTGQVRGEQYIETQNILPSQTYILSAYVKSNKVGAGIAVFDDETSGAGDTDVYTALHSGSGAWERLSVSFTTRAAEPYQLFIRFALTPTGNGSITSGDYIEIKEVQLEVGSVATPFEHRSYAQELQLCMRYYQVSVGMWGFAYSNTATIFGWKPSVPFRASPTMGATGNLKLDEPAIRNETQSSLNFYSFNFDGNSADHLMFGAGSFSGLNTGKPHYVRNDGGSTTWDAEL